MDTLKKMLCSFLFLSTVIQVFAQDTIRLKPYIENMKTVDVFIEGKKYNFLFDTGGSKQLFRQRLLIQSRKKSMEVQQDSE